MIPGANPSLTLRPRTWILASIQVNATQNYTFGGSGALFGNGTCSAKSGSGTSTFPSTL